MSPAPYSPNEKRRLAAVYKLRLMGTPVEERFDRITRLARQLFDVPMAALDIVGEKLEWLKNVQGFDGIEGLRKDSYCHHTVLKDGLCFVRDARIDPRFCDSVFADTWVFYAGAPLHFEGERVGVLCIGDTKPREFTFEKLSGLSDLALLAERELEIAALSEAQIALALSNEELEQKANIDMLTHVWNRGAIMNIVEVELSRASSNHVLAALMIDIDDYKQINDTYGHVAGDHVLREIAERLRKALRPVDAIGRYGGDEFLAVLVNIGMNQPIEIGKRICQKISQEPILFQAQTIKVTCSIGSAIANAPEDMNAFLERADAALYHAKSAGRNRMEAE